MATTKSKPYHALKVKGKNYRIRFTTNAIVELEDAMNRTRFPGEREIGLPQLAGMFQRGDFTVKQLRTTLWAGLLTEHDGEIDEKEAGEILDAAPSYEAVLDPLAEALKARFGGPSAPKPNANGRSSSSEEDQEEEE